MQKHKFLLILVFCFSSIVSFGQNELRFGQRIIIGTSLTYIQHTDEFQFIAIDIQLTDQKTINEIISELESLQTQLISFGAQNRNIVFFIVHGGSNQTKSKLNCPNLKKEKEDNLVSLNKNSTNIDRVLSENIDW